MRISVIDGPPGSGKSTQLLSVISTNPGKYLFASPTIDLIDEQYARVRSMDSKLTVRAVHSRTKQRESVIRQVPQLPREWAALDHAVAFITHESLMEADLSAFTGWHLCIDEPPHAVASGKLNVTTSWATFEREFALEAEGVGWSRLIPQAPAATWKQVQRDSLWGKHTDFRKHVHRQQGVFVHATDWRQGKERDLEWLSLWTPFTQSSFASITVAGAGYLKSVGFKAMQCLYPDLIVDVRPVASTRAGQPSITIGYFTDAHRGSTVHWSKSEGRRCLVAIERWMTAHAPGLGFWSGNEVVRASFEHRVPGIMTSPKLAGLNQYRRAVSCAYIYSCKPQPDDATLKEIFGLTNDDIYAAREGEDLLQFAMRGSIRMPDFGGAYDVYLYSLDQAEFLKQALLDSGFERVELRPLPEAGLMTVRRPKVRRDVERTPVEQEERTAQRRKENARRNREYRGRKRDARLADRTASATS